MTTSTASTASAFYIESCSTAELVELAFDAQRNLTGMIEREEGTQAEHELAIRYKADVKAELVRRATR